jgi:metallo-beta-lactamase family protein
MDIVFHGAAGEVTGSCHLVETAGRRVLLDCGMVQGEQDGRRADERNATAFPFDPGSLDALVLSQHRRDGRRAGQPPSAARAEAFRAAVHAG